MPEGTSLAGVRVLLTRAPDRARAWTAALESRGAIAEPREVFVLEAVASDEVGGAVERIASYAWILLTSANGLRFLHEALTAAGKDLAGQPARFGVVGPQTRTALEALGARPQVVAAKTDAGGLADAVIPLVDAGQRVLVVRPEVSRPELVERLRADGVAVDAVAFYRNRAAEGVAVVAREWRYGAFDAAVFSSPSSFSHLCEALAGEAGAASPTPLIAIGDTTAAAIRASGHEVAAVARRPTPEGIADAVETALSR